MQKAGCALLSRPTALRPFDKKINPLETEIDISVSPESIAAKYNIPRKLKSVWGGFPGNSQLKKWTEYSMESLRNETKTAFDLYEKEPWDIFFVYFNMLEGRPFTLSCEAKDAVSIGLVKVGIEAKEIDWS